MWLTDSPKQPMIINAVLVFGGPPLELDRVRQLVRGRVLSHPSMARFSQRLVADRHAASGYAWEPDAHFELERHVFAVPPSEAPHSEAELQVWLAELVAEPLPRDRPLWALLLVEDFAGGGSALVFRCHHVVGDGIVMSGVLLQLLMDPGPDEGDTTAVADAAVGGRDAAGVADAEARRSRRHASTPASRSRWRRLVASARDVWLLPRRLAELMLSGEDYSAMHRLWELSGARRIGWSRALPLDAVKRVKDHFGAGCSDARARCSVNDVLLSAASAALGRYLRQLTDEITADGAVPPISRRAARQLVEASEGSVTLGIPFNVRSAAEMARVVLENKFAVLFVSLPLRSVSRRARLATVTRSMRALVGSGAPFAMWASLQAVTRLLPASCATSLVDIVADGATAIVTNNRGPSVALRFDGRPCSYWVSWAPQRASVGVCLTLYSYAGSVRCSVNADASCVPEPGVLADMVAEEVEAMAETAGWRDPDVPAATV